VIDIYKPALAVVYGDGMRTFTFKVKLRDDRRIWRKIEALGGQTLDNLHWAIQEAYGFDSDHLYSYFMSGRPWDLSGYEYYHPDAAPQSDLEERMREMMARIRGRFPEPRLPATEVKLESLNLKPRQRFLYLYDYGDEWLFEVEFVREDAPEDAAYPRVLASRGESPPQYEFYDE
jgi:Plasmid pRiA4b ORF-3-like protein